MISNANTLPEIQVACEVCMREIPFSEAKSEERLNMCSIFVVLTVMAHGE